MCGEVGRKEMRLGKLGISCECSWEQGSSAITTTELMDSNEKIEYLM